MGLSTSLFINNPALSNLPSPVGFHLDLVKLSHSKADYGLRLICCCWNITNTHTHTLLRFPFGFDMSTHQSTFLFRLLLFCKDCQLWLLAITICSSVKSICGHYQKELPENECVESSLNQSNIKDVWKGKIMWSFKVINN